MNSDIVAMIGNLSQSLLPFQALIAGLGYLIGILFMITAIGKLRVIGNARARGGGSHEKMFIPLAYLIGGTALIFLPSAITVLSRTAFGSGNILQYASYNPYNIYNTMRIVIRVAGIIWFVRGSVLLVHASEPGVQHGPKGLAFLLAGVLAINFEETTAFVNYMITKLINLTQSMGF